MRKTQTNQVHELIHAGPPQRLDQVIKAKFSDISRSYLQDLISKGAVTVDGIVGKKGTVVQVGCKVRIDAFVHPDDRLIQPAENPSLQIKIETAHYIIIEKVAGRPTHPNAFDDQSCVANHFIALYPEAIDVGEDALRPGIVHRLDTNTSGLLILAKTQEAFLAFRKMFDLRQIHKTYHALVHGVILSDELVIDTDLAHHHQNPRKMVALTDATVKYRSSPRASKTMVRVLKRYDGVTLIEVKTLTGRMHQVRVHLSSIGHSLVGDDIYQSQKEKSFEQYGLQRHFLHAVSLAFEDPWSKSPQHVESIISSELQACMERVK